MTNAALARKLARRERGPRAAAQLGDYGGYLERAALNARDLLDEEQDRRRENLAEELLKIGLETVNPRNFCPISAAEEETGAL